MLDETEASPVQNIKLDMEVRMHSQNFWKADMKSTFSRFSSRVFSTGQNRSLENGIQLNPWIPSIASDGSRETTRANQTSSPSLVYRIGWKLVRTEEDCRQRLG